MPATSSKAQPIIPYQVLSNSGAQASMRRLAEKATQTFLIGTPVQVDVAAATGYLIACPAMAAAATAIIAGFSAEKGHNLTTSGTAPAGGASVNQGAPQNQPNALIIPGGAWPSDGTCGIHVAENPTEFVGIFGDGADNTIAITAVTDLAKVYGLTKDAGNNYWYIDHAKTTVAGGACVEITGFIDAIGTLNGKLKFRVLSASQQLKF